MLVLSGMGLLFLAIVQSSRFPVRPARSWMIRQATRPEREARVTDHSLAPILQSRGLERLLQEIDAEAPRVALDDGKIRVLVDIVEAKPPAYGRRGVLGSRLKWRVSGTANVKLPVELDLRFRARLGGIHPRRLATARVPLIDM